MIPDEDRLVEALAAVVHKHWEDWAGYIMASEPNLRPERMARWAGYFGDYESLAEEVKELDRKFAREHLAVVKKHLQESHGRAT